MFGVAQVALGWKGVETCARRGVLQSQSTLREQLGTVGPQDANGGGSGSSGRSEAGRCVAKILWGLFHGIDDPSCG